MLGLVHGLGDVVAVVAGGSHSLALKADGTAWAWGSNSSGQLGDGTNVGEFCSLVGPCRTTPVRVLGLTGIIAVAAGFDHSFAPNGCGHCLGVGLKLPPLTGVVARKYDAGCADTASVPLLDDLKTDGCA